MSTLATVDDSRDRAQVPDRFKWNLADLYPDVAAWRAERSRVAGELPRVRQFESRLAESPGTLAEALELISGLDKDLTRLFVYASMLSDEDTREAGPRGMQQEMQQLHATFGAQAAYLEPEILRLDRAVIERFVAAEPRLAPYAFYLHDIARRAAHTLSDNEERLLADAAPLAGSASNIYDVLANADFPYPTIALSDGRSVKVDQAGFMELRASPNRADREAAMSAFFTALGSFRRTFGTTINSEVQKVLFYATARKYGSNLELALDGPHIPADVYARLIDGVNRHLPTFHRYLRLRKRMLGIADDLHYYDLYAPLVASVNRKYTPAEAEAHILASLAPLGAGYVSVVRQAFEERWIDWYPTEGKRSGAYSSGSAHAVHPFMLLNYLGLYNDVSTVTHELGHTMQSYYSNLTQPYPLAGYPTFVAEVASTFNEALLIDYMLRQNTDHVTRLALLGNYLENIKATVFRQTQFAEFELRMHEVAQKGEAITGEGLSDLYTGITRRYYGHDAGICIVDDYVAHEWSYIPHFYRDFYVFQYATSFTAAEALVSKVLAGDRAATDRYLTFLAAGGSRYPIDLLKDAGVDMTTDEPLNLTMEKMTRVMDQIDALLEHA